MVTIDSFFKPKKRACDEVANDETALKGEEVKAKKLIKVDKDSDSNNNEETALLWEEEEKYMHESWRKMLQNEFRKPYFKQLKAFLKKERESKTSIFPPGKEY